MRILKEDLHQVLAPGSSLTLMGGGMLDEAIEDAYFLKYNQAVSVRLPFDATGMRCSLCQNYMLNPVGDYAFSVTDHTTCVDITPVAAGK